MKVVISNFTCSNVYCEGYHKALMQSNLKQKSYDDDESSKSVRVDPKTTGGLNRYPRGYTPLFIIVLYLGGDF